MDHEQTASPSPAAASLPDFLLYFLRLGTFGFGGPIALAGHMQQDLVDARGWISKDDYLQGLALAQLAPGPLAAQLAMYLGWVRARVLGATLVGVAFILPSFVMVLVLSALYVRFGGLSWIQGLFYGIAAAVIAIIARSAYKLARMTLSRDPLLWAIFALSCFITAWTESEILWVFVLGGVIAVFVKTPPRLRRRSAVLALAPFWSGLLTGLHEPAGAYTLWRIFWYFAEAGSFVFGSGLAIVPFLYGGVVERLHWLDARLFVDAVAVAMITPGPVVITVGFIGYLVAGPLGATAAALGVFLPCYLMVLVLAPYFRRIAGNRRIKAFVDGVTSAATGAIAGAAIVLGRRAVVDVPTALIAFFTLALLLTVKKLPEPLIILAAGAAGIAIRTWSA